MRTSYNLYTNDEEAKQFVMMKVLAIFLCFCIIIQATSAERGMMVGGKEPINPRDVPLEGIDKALDMAREKLSSNSCSKFVSQKIIKAEAQVVEGILYFVKIEIAPKDKTKDCQLLDDCRNELYVCSFNIWSRSWLKDPDKQLLVDKLHCDCEFKQ
ncbi:cystatin [Exaiptasia diaphana]|uniref:Cystatin domain-containing protein n=1 Tax=Exaiptasia diaphana TaxID=2652724 RepID=A0A913Y142_EXADI|nr:cystatin [Exaiptasia diaphana]